VSPRPEDETASYIDHRVSSKPLVEAFLRLGERAEVENLEECTLAGMSRALREAYEAKRPFHAVHFDGHGVYHRKTGLGALCFEDPADSKKLKNRAVDLVSAEQLAEVLREYRVALMVLEACQSAKSDEDPMASVAGRLLESGVASVVAMSHLVLVATAARFVETFYDKLSTGSTVGKAVLEAQTRLREDPTRGRVLGDTFRMQDWFVPVLFQEQQDPQLVFEVPGRRTGEEIVRQVEASVAGLPDEPSHGFTGRSRELLAVERLLQRQNYAVILGEGGEGKTTLAAELARWLVKTRRFGKAAFVSVEDETAQSVGGVLKRLGGQLVLDFPTKSRGDLGECLQLVERALRDRPTLLVLDNMESLLGDSLAAGVYEPEILRDVLELVRKLLKIAGTRVVFTSRSPLPDPFAMHQVRIGRLAKQDAVAVVGSVIGADPEGVEEDEDVEALVDAVNCHARSLVLLAKEVSASGVRGATERMHELMSAMASRYPDDRERSLFASVELSLRRLPAEMREKLGRLGVFQGGGHLDIIAMVLGIDRSPSTMQPFAKELIEVGLAEAMPYGHLRLHPALAPALLLDLDDDERPEARAAWTAAMVQLTGFLYQQQSKAPHLSAGLTLLELPNLLAALDALDAAQEKESAGAEQVVGMATRLEGLLANLGRPRALDRVVRVREEAARKLGDWSHALYLTESATIDRLLDAGRSAEAVEHARALAGRTTVAGEAAYAGAAYDLAAASTRLGLALRMSGDAEAALTPLRDARERFSRLAASGDADVERMASVCLAETGTCLTALGRLDEAEQAFEESIELA
ncbi:MAG: CHAT domain-containing protein, partial [Acidobacteriota bacterium]